MLKTVWKRIILLIAIIGVWGIGSKYTNPIFIPSPLKVLEDFKILLLNGELFIAIKYSFMRVSVAALLSVTISIPIALLIYNSKIAKDLLNPIIGVMRYIPVTAFYPLLIMWFGIDEMMKVVFLFIAAFVYMMPSVILCLEEINPDLIDTGLTIGMNKFQTIYRIQIPASLPSILNSFVMMYGIGFTYIAVAETINAKYGLGWIIQQSSSRGKTDMVFMAIIVIMVISIIFDAVSKWLIRRIFRWRYIGNDQVD
ncbi:MAG: ABC transporter permease [Eisenbergiella sp.]